jgi:hypothetical protein
MPIYMIATGVVMAPIEEADWVMNFGRGIEKRMTTNPKKKPSSGGERRLFKVSRLKIPTERPGTSKLIK